MNFYKFAFIATLIISIAALGCADLGSSHSADSHASNPELAKETKEKSAETSEKVNFEGDDKTLTVYKSPTCGCCTMWENHLEKAGFTVASKPVENMTEVRKELGVLDKMQSCHTGLIGGYVIEGHVPADDVKRLLKERPEGIAGLAAPGMPAKSPGMQPDGEKPSGYDVLAFDKEGNSKVFSSY